MKIRKFQIPFHFIIFALLFPIFALALLMTSPQKAIQIPLADKNETSNWKVYKNTEYHFSFKYPDYLLSNFQVNTNEKSSQTLHEIASLKAGATKKDANAYNVVFEADAWKTNLKLEDFIDKNLPETNDLEKQKIQLGNIEGFRITNQNKKSDAYFEYNLFKHGNYLYNFAIISDESILVKGNTPLLYKIISTASFD